MGITEKVSFLKKQWPWWTAGLATGLAEAINFWFIPLSHPKHKFIGVTSGMARMLAGLESTLTGGSLIATKADYQPDIQWVIIGAIITALVFAWLEGELRDWVRYPKRFLMFTALGAFLFAWGTRVAGGCTLHHLLGGWAAMNIKSYVVMIVATIGAIIGIYIMRLARITPYFKSQDTKWYVEKANSWGWADGLTFDVDYNWQKDFLRLALYAFWAIFAIVILYMALFGNNYAVAQGWAASLEDTKIYHSMLLPENIGNIILLLIIGGLLGLSVAKTGFGTECAIMTPEMGYMFSKDEINLGRKWGFTYSIRTVFMSMGPIVAYAVHILIASTAFFLAFALFGIVDGHHVPWHDSMRNWPNLPLDIFGGLLLGMGTVFMLGCEFRNYGRTGLLYITGLLIWPFFYLGYLPYTLARDFWDGIMSDPAYRYVGTTFLPELLAPGNHAAQVAIWVLYLLFWAFVLYISLKIGARNLGVTIKDLLTKNSEELYMLRIEKLKEKDPKRFEEVDALEKELAEIAEKDFY